MPEQVPEWLLSAISHGFFALAASFCGAWVALKFQERHEARKKKDSKREAGVRAYVLLEEQLAILSGLQTDGFSWKKNDLWLTAITRLREPSRSISFDTSSLQALLPDMTSGLFRDIVIAQNRFLSVLEQLDKGRRDLNDGVAVAMDPMESEIKDSIVLLTSVTNDLRNVLNFRYASGLPDSEQESVIKSVLNA